MIIKNKNPASFEATLKGERNMEMNILPKSKVKKDRKG